MQLNPTRDTNRRQAEVALKFFFNLSKRWKLRPSEERTLLGEPPDSTFYKWKAEGSASRLSNDTLDRISYLMGIYKGLQILLPSERSADEWVKRPNTGPLFNGQTPLERMLSGKIVDLSDVRRYIDFQRGH